MALRQSDILIHNNPDLAVVDSDFIKGGFRTAVATLSDLYSLSGKTDLPAASGQLKAYSTIVYVSGDSKYYILKDVANVGNINGWQVFNSGSGTLEFATNGLHTTLSGSTVILGGALTTGTTITISSGTSLTIADNRIIPIGIQYASDYSGNFSSNSLITKKYADTIATGLRPKAAVKVATTGSIPLSGLTAIDGISIISGDRVLVKDQISGVTNGVYSASTGTWGRSPDFDGVPTGEVVSGTYMWVLSGATNGNTAWVLVTPDPIYVDTTPLEFILFSHISDIIAGTGITINTLGGVRVINLDVPTQDIVNSSTTGSTNGICKYDSHNVCLTNSVQSILSSSLTGATGTGISSSARNVCLTTATIATINSAVTGSTNGICKYDSHNVCLDNTSQAVINSAITGATNGLTSVGRNIALGGNLTNNTCIDGAYNLLYGENISLNNYCVNANNIGLFTSGGTSSVSLNNSGHCIDTVGIIKVNTAPASGLNSDSILVWNSSDKIVKTISGGAVLNSAITGATNGLTKSGQIVKLGGNLTGNTVINLSGNTLRLQSDNTNIYGLASFELNTVYSNSKFNICSYSAAAAQWGLSGGSNTISSYHCSNPSNGSSLDICDTCLVLSNKVSSAPTTVYLTTSGLTYGDNYCNNNPRWIPDKQYVDNEVNTCIITSKIKLNGLYSGGSYYAFSCDEIILVSGVSTSQIFLPASPVVCDGRSQRISIVDVCGNALNDPITINGNGVCINSFGTSVVNTDYGSVTFVYNGMFWSAIAFVN